MHGSKIIWQKRHKEILSKAYVQQREQRINDDPSVYDYEDPEATQEDDMEEDLALLNDSDMGW